MCGISAVISNDNIFEILYESLFHLQHRGQNSNGFAIYNQEEKQINVLKNDGILNNSAIKPTMGNIGMGHVRYPTSGSINSNEIQPFVLDNIALCHNGTIANYQELIEEYQNKIINKSESDSELLLNIFCYELKKHTDRLLITNPLLITDDIILQVIQKIYQKCKGGYSVIILIPDFGLVCFKDPHGIRPLVYGKSEDSYIVGSESVAITNLSEESHIIKEIEAGEVVIFKNKKNKNKNKNTINNDVGQITVNNYQLSKDVIKKPCIFEWIYISREDSIIHNVSVYQSRLKMGEYLAKKMIRENVDMSQIDAIVPVPDTSRPVALRISEVLNIPYREAIVKNRYIARTFIMDNQTKRKKNISRKLSVTNELVENKNILIVDDSIVRGNTMSHIIEMLYKNNVKSIIVASSAPMIKYQNFYGLDIPTKEELIAYNRTIGEMEKKFNIKKLIFLSISEVCKSVSDCNPELDNFELSVFDGNYIH